MRDAFELDPLLDSIAGASEDADAFYVRLRAERVEAQVVAYGGRGWIRLSAAAYNEAADYERLAAVLPQAVAMSSESTIR
ncbi:hypothetical protein BH10ACT10_BH10ACT10_24610 [soil metagenome]